MSCIKASFSLIKSSLEGTAIFVPAISARGELVSSDFTAEGLVVASDFIGEVTCIPADFKGMYEYATMTAYAQIDRAFVASYSLLRNFVAKATINEQFEAKYNYWRDFEGKAKVAHSGFKATAELVCRAPNAPRLDLSKYHIWVVPEYYENVDVYSNTDWTVS